MQPVPTPKKQHGPGFLLLYAGRRPDAPGSLNVEAIDLAREPDEVAARIPLLRRYLFEYRTELQLPLALLLDADSRVRKFYSTLPSEQTMRADLARINQSRDHALPFKGRYYSDPQRNYFKLGAAFYWAGYPMLALPYLEETVRNKPDNWKALLAIGRIEQESGRFSEAMERYRKVLSLRPDYPPVLVNAAEVFVSLNDRISAEKALNKALEVDPIALTPQTSLVYWPHRTRITTRHRNGSSGRSHPSVSMRARSIIWVCSTPRLGKRIMLSPHSGTGSRLSRMMRHCISIWGVFTLRSGTRASSRGPGPPVGTQTGKLRGREGPGGIGGQIIQ